MSLPRITYVLISLVLAFVVLQQLESLIIPFIFSVIIWLIIRKVRRWLQEYFSKMPKWAATFSSTIFVLLFLVLSIRLIGTQVKHFYADDTIQKYSTKLSDMVQDLEEYLGADVVLSIREKVLEKVNEFDYSQVGELAGVLSGVLGSMFMVLLYLLFLILEENLFRVKLKTMYPVSENRLKVKGTIDEITKAVESYISLKTIVSLLTGAASYIALLIIGVDFALFWAILIFILNYIPTIGSLIATLFPALIAFIQFEQLQMFVLVLIVIGAIQVVVGNIIEPKIMGDNLNISPLVVILSLVFWNMVWGIVGMILSVPIMVIIIIILSKIPGTRNVALMLSGTGKTA